MLGISRSELAGGMALDTDEAIQSRSVHTFMVASLLGSFRTSVSSHNICPCRAQASEQREASGLYVAFAFRKEASSLGAAWVWDVFRVADLQTRHPGSAWLVSPLCPRQIPAFPDVKKSPTAMRSLDRHLSLAMRQPMDMDNRRLAVPAWAFREAAADSRHAPMDVSVVPEVFGSHPTALCLWPGGDIVSCTEPDQRSLPGHCDSKKPHGERMWAGSCPAQHCNCQGSSLSVRWPEQCGAAYQNISTFFILKCNDL